MTPLWLHWKRLARTRPSATALIDLPGDIRISRAQLSLSVDSWTPLLKPFRPGQILAFTLPNSPEWISLFLATQRRGIVALPLDPSLHLSAASHLATRLRAHALWHQNHLLALPRPRRRPGISLIRLTSGSTGSPQPLPCRTGHLVADGRHILAAMRIRPSDRNLGLIPLNHAYAMGNLLMPLLLQGTALALAPQFLPAQIPPWILRHRLTVFPAVPAILRLLAHLPGSRSLAPLRTLISAGAPLDPATAGAFHQKYGIAPHNFYGSSETGGISFDATGRAAASGSGVGKPLPGVRVALRRKRILVSSPAVVHPAGRILLRDYGAWNPDGSLRVLGRADSLLNIAGKKLHPHEVANALRGLPGVHDVWVGTGTHQGRTHLLAAVESSSSEASLRAGLKKFLPDWKQPRRLLVLRHFPRNARGKIDATSLQSAFAG